VRSYFDHFHPYFPVVRIRDPDRCYKQGSVLFWAIVTVSCRRYARDEDVFTFLLESLPKEIANVSNPPFSLATINALLLLCAWPLPTIRFLIDPSTSYVSIAMNACLLLGLHTGRGFHPEFAIGPRKFDISDDEARYAWAGYNIVAQR
jgi:transcriptional regulatory protein LEU3